MVAPRFRDGVISYGEGLSNSKDGGVQLGSDEGKLIIGVVGSENPPSGVLMSGVFASSLTTVLFCGVWKDVGTGEVTTILFRSGWVLEAKMAFFSFCADLSAFNAAAVVMATFGVTARGRLDDDTAT